MPRPKTLEYAAQLEARARDIRNAEIRRLRVIDTRVKVLLGALSLSFAGSGDQGLRLLEAFARLPALKVKDSAYLAAHLPPHLAVPFKAVSQAPDGDSFNV